MNRRIRLLTLLALAAFPSLGASAAAEVRTRTLVHGDIERRYLVYAPGPARGAESMPLALLLHGGGGTAEQMMRFSRFNDIAARERFAVAYPEGVGRRWNDGRVFRGRGETDADDVGFVRALVAAMANEVPTLDRRRVYAAGISNGGFMSLRLACEAADLFAAVAPVTATMPADLAANCRPRAPVSVLVINGTADPLVPYDGGHVRTLFGRRGAIWSTDRTLAFWAKHNGCAAAPAPRVLPDRDATDGSHAIAMTWPRCAGGQVQLMRIEGGGHTWPGAAQYLPERWIGPVNRDIDASEAIWQFFKSAPAR